MTPLLSIRDLTTRLSVDKKIYPVVKNFSLDIKKGTTHAIVGESGSGKSVTALSLLRILPQPPFLPSLGAIHYQGKNILDLSEKEMRKIRGSKIAMIFQDPKNAFNPVYTIGSQLLEVVEVHLNLKGKSAYDHVLKTLEDVALASPEQRMKEYPHQMSGGMLQRAMIAMALLCSPDLLIADEPTTALDVTIQAQILATLKQLQKKSGMAILLITHDMGVVAEMADEVSVMYALEKVENCNVHEMFSNPLHPYTKALFSNLRVSPDLVKKGKIPILEGSVPSITALPQGCHFHPRCSSALEKCKVMASPTFSPLETHQVKCWRYDKSI